MLLYQSSKIRLNYVAIAHTFAKIVIIMKKIFKLLLLLTILTTAKAQKDTSWKTLYRATPDKINNLVHTKLKLTPNFDKEELVGEEWVTLTPHFYDVKTLILQANSMDIKEVALINGTKKTTLGYIYLNNIITINLNKTYKQGEKYTIYIAYTAKPNNIPKEKGLQLENKGIYFINANGKTPNTPTQIWTQGETEQASSWFPTIDRTAQKCTQEMYITVPNKYVTLSNGLLKSQTKNANGTRTDYWNMDLPHSPYLFFMGVGDYAIIKDTYKGKAVDYYVEKEYATTAKQIFGNTPEMIGFFSKILGVDYPWQKYAQITGRDYVAGAMENTTATIHQETAQQDARQLADGNIWEGTIAHELFHQWFGDLVTAESWSNLTLNESFADYSEYLWSEYKYGRDDADQIAESAKQQYFSSGEKLDLVRFYYNNQEDMFDRVSYSKGGRILHMLRYFLGDKAFFKGLNKYLTDNKFKTAEAHDLRLAMEAVSGKDLNWFFNQWYFNNGHAKVSIDYAIDYLKKQATVTIKQNTDKAFILPINIDVYTTKGKTRTMVMVDKKEQIIEIAFTEKPLLINVDADRTTLWTKKDNRIGGTAAYKALYEKAGLYADRDEAISYFAKNQLTDDTAKTMLITALNDKYFGLRNKAINALDKSFITKNSTAETTIINLAKNDPKKLTVAAAIRKLGGLDNAADYKNIFEKAITDNSYTVAGRALNALSKTDLVTAKKIAVTLKAPIKGALKTEIAAIKYKGASEADFDAITNSFVTSDLQDKFQGLSPYIAYVGMLTNINLVQKALATITAFRDKADAIDINAGNFINNSLNTLYKTYENNKATAEILTLIKSQIKVYKIPESEE